MKMTFIVTADVERVTGTNESREAIAEEIRGYLEDDADPGMIWGPEGGEYKVSNWIARTE